MNKLITVFTFLLLNQTIMAQIYVKVDGHGDGSSWSSPLGSLTAALNLANGGHSIWVARGTYYPTQCSNCTVEDRDKSFHIPDGVVVLGGFAGTEISVNQRDWVTNPTILSGDIDRDGTIANNAYSVVTTNNVGPATIVDGFFITRGNANGAEGSLEISRQSGGAWFNGSIANSISSPTIRNCTFSRNEAVAFGGAMYNFGSFGGSSSPTYINCRFTNNKCNFDGGAVYNNGAFGGTSKPLFSHCEFNHNQAGRITGSGGAIYNNAIEGECSPKIVACTFSANSASHSGGAIYNQGKSGQSHPHIVNSLFYQNNATEGGAMYNLGAENGASNPTVINCTFYENFAENGAVFLNNGISNGTCNPRISNSILWENRAVKGNVFYNVSATPYIEYSLVDVSDCTALNQHFHGDFSTVNCGAGMLYEEIQPKFVFPSAGDLHLKFNSQAINKGQNSLIINESLDLDKQHRISLGQVDLGAFEYDGPLPTLLDSFTLENHEAFIQIRWHILHEYQNAGFKLQRSIDGNSFETLAFINSQGDSETPQFYTFQDADIILGSLHTYRLQRLDVDGCFEFSETAEIFIEVVETSIHLAPNPTHQTAYLTLSLPEEKAVHLELVNSFGQTELVFTEIVARGQRIIPIDVSRQSDGLYFVWVTMGNERFSYALVVTHY